MKAIKKISCTFTIIEANGLVKEDIVYINRLTSLIDEEASALTREERGKILSSSSMTMHVLHDARDNRNLSLKRETISACASVR